MADTSFKVKNSLNLQPIAGASPSAEGDVVYDDTANSIKYNNGSSRTVANLDEAQTFTNKTLTSPAGIVKGDVGLGNVDNTSDVNKPVSTANAVAHSTGVITGGVLSVGSPNTTFSITDGTGMVTNNTVTPATVTQVSWTGKTNITATYIASGLVSYVGIDNAGNVFQQLTAFTNAQSRTYIILGSLIHVNLTNLDAVNQQTEVAISPMNQVNDLNDSLGIFNVSGNVFSANGTNLNLNKSIGKVHARGANWGNSTSDPSVLSLASLTALSFQYRFSTGTNGATGIAINPAIYDVAGVSTAVPTNKVTIQRIYSFVSNNVKIQPGQAVYNSIAEAKAAIQNEVFVTEPSIAANGILRGFLVVKQGSTALNSATSAFFYEAAKFNGQVGIGGQSVSSMQNAYDNSLDPEILTDATRLALSVRRGSGADTDNILEGMNNASSVTFAVTGNGVVTTSGNILASADSSMDIGTATASRPGSIYAVTAVAAGRYPAGGGATVAALVNGAAPALYLYAGASHAFSVKTDANGVQVYNTGAGITMANFNYVTGYTQFTNSSSVNYLYADSAVIKSASPVLTGSTGTVSASAQLEVISTTKGAVSAPVMTATQRDAVSAPATGLQVYNSTTSKLNVYNGSAWREVGTSTSGSNYISDADGSAIGVWVTYADAAATSPVDGTGGSPASTFAVSTNSDLRSTTNFLWTHTAVNRQGEGFSYAFTIDAADKYSVLQCSLDYLVASGTYADDDLQFWIYDVTNSVLIQPAPYKLKNATIAQKFAIEFQATSSTSYRLIAHVATATATAYTIRFDNWNLGPQAKLYGSPITDWVSFTPTNLNTTNVSSNTAYYRRVGDLVEITGRIVWNGAGGTASVWSTSLPSGLTIDTAKINSSAADTHLGNYQWRDSGTAFRVGSIIYLTTSTVQFTLDSSTGSQIGTDFASGDTLNYTYKVPITGWSSSVIMSSDAATNVVGMSALSQLPTGTLNGSANIMVFGTKSYDTDGSYNTTTGLYTVKVPGKYEVYGQAQIQTTLTVGQTSRTWIFKNGTGGTQVAGSASFARGSESINTFQTIGGSIDCVAGDTLGMYAATEGSTNSYTTSYTGGSSLKITRISGPAQIAASETVAGRWTSATATSTATAANSVMAGLVSVTDSHGIMNVTTGVATIPISGRYRIAYSTQFSSTAMTAGSNYLLMKLTGTQTVVLDTRSGWATSTFPMGSIGSTEVSLLAGHTVSITISNSSGSTLALNTDTAANWITITRVGNY